MGLRELMILLLILAIVGVILRGLYVALRARRGQLRMALEKNIPQYDPDELISSELPNGGARLVQRSFEQVVKRNSEFTARDQAIPVLMDTLGEDEPLDEPPRASSVANARNAARQKHSQRALKPVHRPIDRMAAAAPLAAGAAPATGALSDDEDDSRHSPAFEQDDEPRESFSAAGYRDDDDRQDDDYDDADDYADDDDDEYEQELDGRDRDQDGDDDDWDDDDDDRDLDDERDDEDNEDNEDNDYDDADDELALRGRADTRGGYDDRDEARDDDGDDDQDDYDDTEEELPESWEEDQDGEDDEPEVEEFDQVYRDDEADDDDVLLKPREGEGGRAESWYEEEEEPAAAPVQDTRSGPRRWLQWAGEKLSGMGAAAAEKAVQEPERVQRAEPVLGLDNFDDDQVSAPRTVTAPTRPVREPLDKSRQKELSLDHPEDEILRERAREREQKPARRQRDSERATQAAAETPAAQDERSAGSAAAARSAAKQRPEREEASRQAAPRQPARRLAAEAPREPAVPDFSEVLVLNVVARPDREITGVEMLQVLLANQLRFGDMAIFHRHMKEADTRTPVLFSVANLLNPGIFDLNRISEFSTRGLCFFMTLPSAASSNMQAFEQMLDAAQKVRIALDADLKDDNRSVMTAQTIEHYRQRVRDFDLRQLRQAK